MCLMFPQICHGSLSALRYCLTAGCGLTGFKRVTGSDGFDDGLLLPLHLMSKVSAACLVGADDPRGTAQEMPPMPCLLKQVFSC